MRLEIRSRSWEFVDTNDDGGDDDDDGDDEDVWYWLGKSGVGTSLWEKGKLVLDLLYLIILWK